MGTIVPLSKISGLGRGFGALREILRGLIVEAKQKSPLSRIVNIKKLHMCHIGVIVILELPVIRELWRVAERQFQPQIVEIRRRVLGIEVFLYTEG